VDLLTLGQAARLVERACRRTSRDILENLGRLRVLRHGPFAARGGFYHDWQGKMQDL
jgi:hypothetical protein